MMSRASSGCRLRYAGVYRLLTLGELLEMLRRGARVSALCCQGFCLTTETASVDTLLECGEGCVYVESTSIEYGRSVAARLEGWR